MGGLFCLSPAMSPVRSPHWVCPHWMTGGWQVWGLSALTLTDPPHAPKEPTWAGLPGAVPWARWRGACSSGRAAGTLGLPSWQETIAFLPAWRVQPGSDFMTEESIHSLGAVPRLGFRPRPQPAQGSAAPCPGPGARVPSVLLLHLLAPGRARGLTVEHSVSVPRTWRAGWPGLRPASEECAVAMGRSEGGAGTGGWEGLSGLKEPGSCWWVGLSSA